MNALWCIGMHERHTHPSQEAKCHKPLFRIVQSVVLEGERRASKDLLGIHEI